MAGCRRVRDTCVASLKYRGIHVVLPNDGDEEQQQAQNLPRLYIGI